MTWQRISVALVWIAALVAGVLIVALVQDGDALGLLGLALGASIVLAFLLQFTVQPIDGLVSRLVASVAGAALLLAVAALVAYLLGLLASA